MLKERVKEELRVLDRDKTKLMLILEREYGFSIVALIRPRASMPSPQLAQYLGISESLLSKWRKRFGYNDVRVAPRGRRKSL